MRDHADGLHAMVLFITGLLPHKRSASGVKSLLPALRGEGWRTVDTVSAESGPRLPVAAYCVHTSLPVLAPDIPQQVVTGRDEPHCCECDTGNLPSGGRGAGDIHGNPHMGA